MQHNKYVEMLTQSKLEWLRKDLSYIPKGSMDFMHAPDGTNGIHTQICIILLCFDKLRRI